MHSGFSYTPTFLLETHAREVIIQDSENLMNTKHTFCRKHIYTQMLPLKPMDIRLRIRALQCRNQEAAAVPG